jgi:hypothetical protein
MSANNYSASTAILPELIDAVDRKYRPYQEAYKGVFQDAPFVLKTNKGTNNGAYDIYREPVITNRYATARIDGTSTPISPYQTGYEKSLRVLPNTHAEIVSYEVHTFGRTAGMLDQMKQLIEAPMNKLELDLAHRFAFAFVTSYVDNNGNTIDTSMGDGLAKISTAHTTTSGTTYSNQMPANPAFSKGALVSGKAVGQRGTVDNLGINFGFLPDIILTTDDEATVLAVRELLYSTQDVSSTGAGTYNNYPSASLKHIASPLICTDAFGQRNTAKEKFWFLIDSKLSSLYLTTIGSPYYTTPTLMSNGVEPLSGSWTFTSGYDYGITEVAGRGTIGSQGTGV